jgi:hypothetical protein
VKPISLALSSSQWGGDVLARTAFLATTALPSNNRIDPDNVAHDSRNVLNVACRTALQMFPPRLAAAPGSPTVPADRRPMLTGPRSPNALEAALRGISSRPTRRDGPAQGGQHREGAPSTLAPSDHADGRTQRGELPGIREALGGTYGESRTRKTGGCPNTMGTAFLGNR